MVASSYHCYLWILWGEQLCSITQSPHYDLLLMGRTLWRCTKKHKSFPFKYSFSICHTNRKKILVACLSADTKHPREIKKFYQSFTPICIKNKKQFNPFVLNTYSLSQWLHNNTDFFFYITNWLCVFLKISVLIYFNLEMHVLTP